MTKNTYNDTRFVGSGNAWADASHRVRGWRLKCAICGAESRVIASSKSKMLPPEVMTRKFGRWGWFVGRKEHDDLCPECYGGSRRRGRPAAASEAVAEPRPPEPAKESPRILQVIGERPRLMDVYACADDAERHLFMSWLCENHAGIRSALDELTEYRVRADKPAPTLGEELTALISRLNDDAPWLVMTAEKRDRAAQLVEELHRRVVSKIELMRRAAPSEGPASAPPPEDQGASNRALLGKLRAKIGELR